MTKRNVEVIGWNWKRPIHINCCRHSQSKKMAVGKDVTGQENHRYTLNWLVLCCEVIAGASIDNLSPEQ